MTTVYPLPVSAGKLRSFLRHYRGHGRRPNVEYTHAHAARSHVQVQGVIA